MQRALQVGVSTTLNTTTATIWDASVLPNSLSIGTKLCGMQSIPRDDLCCTAFATGARTTHIQ